MLFVKSLYKRRMIHCMIHNTGWLCGLVIVHTCTYEPLNVCKKPESLQWHSTHLHHILAVLTHYTCKAPLVELGDLLQQCFPKKYSIPIKFSKSNLTLGLFQNVNSVLKIFNRLFAIRYWIMIMSSRFNLTIYLTMIWDWLAKFVPLSQPTNKPKTIVPCLQLHLVPLAVATFSVPFTCTSFVIGQSDYMYFGSLNWEPLYIQ